VINLEATKITGLWKYHTKGNAFQEPQLTYAGSHTAGLLPANMPSAFSAVVNIVGIPFTQTTNVEKHIRLNNVH
jgi:hypothetical protein